MHDYITGICVGMLIVLYFWLLYMKERHHGSIHSPVSISMVTKGGHTPVIRKRDTRFRNSPNNTVLGFIIYKDGKRIGYLENEK